MRRSIPRRPRGRRASGRRSRPRGTARRAGGRGPPRPAAGRAATASTASASDAGSGAAPGAAARVDELAGAAAVGGDDGRAAGQRLEHGETEGLAGADRQGDVGGGDPRASASSRPSTYPWKVDRRAVPAISSSSSRCGPSPYTSSGAGTPRRCSSTAVATARCGDFSRERRPTWASRSGPRRAAPCSRVTGGRCPGRRRAAPARSGSRRRRPRRWNSPLRRSARSPRPCRSCAPGSG